MKWICDVNDDIYDPNYTDMLRVAFTSEFGRGNLQDLVALLSGRNFVTKAYEDAIAEDSFKKLKNGILAFINETHFDRITMILRSAGFITSDMITSPKRGQLCLHRLPAWTQRASACGRVGTAGAPLVCHVGAAGPIQRLPRVAI